MLLVTSPGTRPSISPRSLPVERAPPVIEAVQRAVVAPADLEPDVVAASMSNTCRAVVTYHSPAKRAGTLSSSTLAPGDDAGRRRCAMPSASANVLATCSAHAGGDGVGRALRVGSPRQRPVDDRVGVVAGPEEARQERDARDRRQPRAVRRTTRPSATGSSSTSAVADSSRACRTPPARPPGPRPGPRPRSTARPS